jgi:hypothetical protein
MEAADRYIKPRQGWTPRYEQQWRNTLNTYVGPVFGNLLAQLSTFPFTVPVQAPADGRW